MGVAGKVLGVALGAAAGAAGVAVAGGAVRAAQQRRMLVARDIDDTTPFGSLHSDPITVVADDGVPLYAEVDDVAAPAGSTRRRGRSGARPVTVVFCHGYALNLDCWHYQRAAFRGLVRTVLYDQRSHGRSGRSPSGDATLDQLGRDLKRVLDDLTHDDPVVLVGHSMGGMTIMQLAEQHPELFGTKVVGVSLVSTTAGGLDPGRILFPMMPAGVGSGVVGRVVGALSRGHRAVDALRTRSHDIALSITDAYAFGPEAPGELVEFLYDMLNQTPFDVVADFYPAFASLDLWAACPVVASVPTAIICGTGDRITSIGHSRKLHARIHGSDLLECDGAGHMVILERPDEVNAELGQLVAHAVDTAAAG
ncbi:alpha/beta fold hydrolase [Nocardioides sp.]|uniref:alpha/beta fold hydrolase n=1 Tax=Nocardioides sp. TaxID=35761 RepID=UPI003529A0C7